MAKVNIGNPLIKRYPPNYRFVQGAFINQEELKLTKDDFGESITDKESYRLNLAGKRGSIASIGSSDKGWYMFPDGKYDHNKDFSYFYRKDLSLVEIDNYIKDMTKAQENADKELRESIQEQIDLANAKIEEIKNKDEVDTPKQE